MNAEMIDQGERTLMNPEDAGDVKRERQLVNALGEFLMGFHWQAYATPTFSIPVNTPQAKRAMERWLGALGPKAYAYVAYERGEAGGRTHAHALVGGLFDGARRRTGLSIEGLAVKRAERLWRRGNIKIEHFDPKQGACWYVAKCPADGELVGELKRHRSRRRRSRKEGDVHHSTGAPRT